MAVFDASSSGCAVRMDATMVGGFRYWLPDLFKGGIGQGERTATRFSQLDQATGAQAVWGGIGLRYGMPGGSGSSPWTEATGGTLGSLSVSTSAGTPVYKLTGLSLALPAAGSKSALDLFFAGHDTLYGSPGDDLLDGRFGNDLLVGGLGNDTLLGGPGDDTVVGGRGVDMLAGGPGIDTVDFSQEGWASLHFDMTRGAATFSDPIDGVLYTESAQGFENAWGTSIGWDTLIGTAGDNALHGNGGIDRLEGRDGNDTLDGSDGDYAHLSMVDLLIGGRGNDLYIVNAGMNALSDQFDTVQEDANAGLDTVQVAFRSAGYYLQYAYAGSAERYQLGDHVERLVLDARAFAPNARAGEYRSGAWLSGAGNGLDNHISVLAGATAVDVVLSGGAGNDTVAGGPGSDRLDGGTGTDTASFAGAAVKITAQLGLTTAQATGAGNDLLLNFENLEGGSAGDLLTGDGNANTLWGLGGNDTLRGGAGNDTLVGGPGADLLAGGAGRDVFGFKAPAELGNPLNRATWDRIADFTRGQDRIDLSRLDANGATAADEAFTAVIGAREAFTAPGQLRLRDGVLCGNTDGDAEAEFALVLTGVSTLTLADVIA